MKCKKQVVSFFLYDIILLVIIEVFLWGILVERIYLGKTLMEN